MSDRERMVLTIPVSPRQYAQVHVSTPMTEAEWDQFHTVLDTMKAGLVEPRIEVAGE